MNNNTPTWPHMIANGTPIYPGTEPNAGDFMIDMYNWIVIAVRGSETSAKQSVPLKGVLPKRSKLKTQS